MAILVTLEDFEKYIEVQKSGVTNMLDVPVVCALSGLTREQVIYIIKNYLDLKKQYDLLGGGSND